MTGNDKARRGHSKEKRSDCPLVTLGLVLDDSGFVQRSRMLAYQAVQVLHQKLAAKQIRSQWRILRETLSTQQRVIVTFQQRDGRTLNVRKATIAEPKLKQIHDALGITAIPGGIQKYVN